MPGPPPNGASSTRAVAVVGEVAQVVRLDPHEARILARR
jgi:hypothetical protein